MRKMLSVAVCLGMFAAFAEDPVDWVNPLIGSTSGGFPACQRRLAAWASGWRRRTRRIPSTVSTLRASAIWGRCASRAKSVGLKASSLCSERPIPNLI